MDLISKIAIKISCNQVGVDEFGNQYFEAKKARNNHKKRSVIYNGIAEPSKIPAHWHGWLHYTSDNIPQKVQKYSWEKIHLPNLTGTKFAHFPLGSKISGGKRSKVSSDYQPWQPNQ
ncbi:MAG: NADH-ubiquinone oxidoreductase subunit NDUFA12 family protein [Pseudomonadota bacterium]